METEWDKKRPMDLETKGLDIWYALLLNVNELQLRNKQSFVLHAHPLHGLSESGNGPK
jgi:hypothetical protein